MQPKLSELKLKFASDICHSADRTNEFNDYPVNKKTALLICDAGHAFSAAVMVAICLSDNDYERFLSELLVKLAPIDNSSEIKQTMLSNGSLASKIDLKWSRDQKAWAMLYSGRIYLHPVISNLNRHINNDVAVAQLAVRPLLERVKFFEDLHAEFA